MYVNEFLLKICGKDSRWGNIIFDGKIILK